MVARRFCAGRGCEGRGARPVSGPSTDVVNARRRDDLWASTEGWVKLRGAQPEQMFSGVPLLTDIARLGSAFANAPRRDSCTAATSNVDPRRCYVGRALPGGLPAQQQEAHSGPD
jgi:hypothetical protein